MRTLTYREALREGLDEELARDENVVIMGEEVAQYNGAYKVTEGLWKKWGDKRVVDTPISEAGFIGMGIGASMLGVRPVMELMFWSFHSVAFDQMVNNAGCVRYMSGGIINCPLVIRGPANGGTNGLGANGLGCNGLGVIDSILFYKDFVARCEMINIII
jgi:pyruvate dehydrogenase E1 component beta subunit